MDQCASTLRAAGAGSMPSLRNKRARTLAAGLDPQLVQAQPVAIRMLVGALADLVERVDHRRELRGQLGEHLAQRAAARRAAILGERAVGSSTHGDVVVDVDQLARETGGEEPGDEQRDVA